MTSGIDRVGACEMLRRILTVISMASCSCAAVSETERVPLPQPDAGIVRMLGNRATDTISNPGATGFVHGQSAMNNLGATLASQSSLSDGSNPNGVSWSMNPVTYSLHVPRLPIQLISNEDDPTKTTILCDPAIAEMYPDEYLFDGGDRGLPVHYDEFNRLGMETEDTVAEYVDHEGQRHVKPTNRVAIYAPRFGALRTVSSPSLGTAIEQLASAQDSVHGNGLTNRVTTQQHQQNDALEGLQIRSRASGFEAKTTGAGTEQVLRVADLAKLQNLYQGIGFIRTGQFEQSDEARLASGIQAAANWSRDVHPIIAATTSSAREVHAEFKPLELVGLEIDHKTKGKLRIVKLADKLTAKPGDTITFNIRYDNLGDLELRDIRVIDNLTPRLEYIEGSAESDRPGNIQTEDNDEGTLILRFTLDGPLPGKSGGVITFQARVR